ncbi:single-stranded DNA-binding protein [Priestia endophytica]|uniref:Single-stranded DNA-binding protein n=2 Tax=Priestia endophytica TaxID=135735 RepID=A0AAX1Q5T1_9BACI|nr:single-stranded DNA-binding protein [Priestia endophytica]KAB2490613.1 single-stranded DNA-binding protein [Priestia endophytica]KYG28535.1 single-stranded DNA-binding protein [Priestia endophytica]MBG9810741.1 single-stranded DNA-binding protein [Priestia endophytica]MCM3540290.1 single-stranded DNA-binding protein [Priestia endophytica]RAS74896.1 single-stranded DNA-binding protein [Priestia endophytica]
MFNQVTLVGRLARVPDLRYTTDGVAYTHLVLAVQRSFRNQHGEFDADFVSVTVWRKNAENTVQYCEKGTLVGITGRVQTRQYERDGGEKVFSTEIIADRIRFLQRKIGAPS